MTFAQQFTVSGGALVAVIALAAVGVALVIAALVDLVRRPAVLGGRKWVWIVVILLFNLIGPILYFAVGRVPPPVDEPGPAEAPGDRVATAADLLYGPSPSAAAPPPRASGDPGEGPAQDAPGARPPGPSRP